MRKLIVVAATNEDDCITFSVIHRQKELIYGRLRWVWFDKNNGELVNIKVNCRQRPHVGERFDNHPLEGYHEAIVKANEWLGDKREQIENKCIKMAVYNAISDGEIVRIINI